MQYCIITPKSQQFCKETNHNQFCKETNKTGLKILQKAGKQTKHNQFCKECFHYTMLQVCLVSPTTECAGTHAPI
jgi:hypothetical protein